MIDEDHRSLAQRLDLFHFQEEAPGMAFWHPNGLILYRILEQLAREELDVAGYSEVRTPQILRRPVWEASGHWQHFEQGMFRVLDQKLDAAVKPVSCPGHVYIAERRHPSYRDLPIRLAEFGVVHRDEPSGTLQGLLRLRQFTQDDGHVFCAFEQALDEVERFCRSVPPFYARFGFDSLELSLATRPADRAGDEALWDRSEAALEEVLKRLGWAHSVQPGGGAFYGPKLEFVLSDRLGRKWQCGTIQFDLVMPERFDLGFVDRGGERRRAVMLHRALYGSLERFLGVLLEHHGQALPAWLSPEQARILPVGEPHAAFAREVQAALRERGVRVGVDDRNESLSRRILDLHQALVPFALVVGNKEVAERSVALRSKPERSVALRSKGEQRGLGLDAALGELVAACRIPPRSAGQAALGHLAE
jgi:threonyl-tRNA synthetase